MKERERERKKASVRVCVCAWEREIVWDSSRRWSPLFYVCAVWLAGIVKLGRVTAAAERDIFFPLFTPAILRCIPIFEARSVSETSLSLSLSSPEPKVDPRKLFPDKHGAETYRSNLRLRGSSRGAEGEGWRRRRRRRTPECYRGPSLLLPSSSESQLSSRSRSFAENDSALCLI